MQDSRFARRRARLSRWSPLASLLLIDDAKVRVALLFGRVIAFGVFDVSSSAVTRLVEWIRWMPKVVGPEMKVTGGR